MGPSNNTLFIKERPIKISRKIRLLGNEKSICHINEKKNFKVQTQKFHHYQSSISIQIEEGELVTLINHNFGGT